MKSRYTATVCVFLVMVVGVLTSCGLRRLALDGSWRVAEIATQTTVTKNLDDWVRIVFDAEEGTATVSTGSAWPEVLRGIDDTFTYEMRAGTNELYLQENGRTIYTITVKVSPTLQKMEWTAWKGRLLTFVGEESPIKRIVFTRR